MKRILLILLLLVVPIVSASQLIPSGNVNLTNRYSIVGAVNVYSANYYGAFNWLISSKNPKYLTFNGTRLFFNATYNNKTIDARLSGFYNGSTKSYVDSQDVSYNTSMKNYVNNRISTAVNLTPNNNSIKSWTNSNIATNNLSLKNYIVGRDNLQTLYIDSQDSAYNVSMGIYVRNQVKNNNASLKSYVDSIPSANMTKYNITIKGWTNSQIATNNGSMKNYVIGKNTSMKSYVDNKDSNYNLSMTTYVNSLTPNFLCYKETANVSANCDDSISGNYAFQGSLNAGDTNLEAIDGNWDSMVEAANSGTYRFNLTSNYTKPINVISAKVRIKVGSPTASEANVSIPSICLIGKTLKIRVTSDRTLVETFLRCRNTTGWSLIYTNSTEHEFYEEALYYTISSDGKPINWTRIQFYPTACPTGAITTLGDSVVCTDLWTSTFVNNNVSILGWVNSKFVSTNTSSKGYTDGKIASNNASVKNYVIGLNTSMKAWATSRVVNNNASLKGYSDGKVASNNASVVYFVNGKFTSNNASQLGYVNGKIASNNASMKAYVDTGNVNQNTSLKAWSATQDVNQNTSLKAWTNSLFGTYNTTIKYWTNALFTAYNTTMKGFVNGKFVSTNTSTKGYTDGKIATNNASMKSYVDNKPFTGKPAKGNNPFLYNVSFDMYFNGTYNNKTIGSKIATNNASMKAYVDAKPFSSKPTKGNNPYLYNTSYDMYFNGTYNNKTVNSWIVKNNASLKGYADSKIATNNASVVNFVNGKFISNNASMIGYTNGKIASNNASLKSYADSKVRASNVSNLNVNRSTYWVGLNTVAGLNYRTLVYWGNITGRWLYLSNFTNNLNYNFKAKIYPQNVSGYFSSAAGWTNTTSISTDKRVKVTGVANLTNKMYVNKSCFNAVCSSYIWNNGTALVITG